MKDSKPKGVRWTAGAGKDMKKCLKQYKIRAERHKAKRNPECIPTYRRYAGWDTYW